MEKESEARPFVRPEVILIEHLRNFAVTIFQFANNPFIVFACRTIKKPPINDQIKTTFWCKMN